MRLAAPRLARSPALAAALTRMADFPHPLVRFQLALALGAIDGPAKVAAMVKLADLENRDPLMVLAIAGSLGRSSGSFLAQLVTADVDWRRKPTAAQMKFLTEVAAVACGSDDPAQFVECLKLIAPTAPRDAAPRDVAPGDLAILAGVAQGLAERGQSLRAMLKAPSSALAPHLAPLGRVVARARELAAGDEGALEQRLLAIEVLGLVDVQSGKILLDLLQPKHAEELQSAAARALADPDLPTAGAMFAGWQNLTTATRRALAVSALRSRVASEALVTALEQEQILVRELDVGVRDGLLAVRDAALKARATAIFEAEPPGQDRKQVVTRFAPLVGREGDRTRGALVFEKHCLACHSLQGRGQRVGPDLSGIAARPKESLVVDLFDPSRELAPNFVAYTLATTQGQVLTGLVAAENAASITLRRAEGVQDVVPRGQIEELRATGKSLMPEGLESSLSEENVVDLMAFLADPDARLFSSAK
jgi:putative heme-binding domain-containing protein